MTRKVWPMPKKLSTVVSVGIDVAQDHVDVCFLDADENVVHKGNYPIDKYPALAKKIAKAKPRIAVMEATGGYERHLATILHAAGVPQRIVNPFRTSQFAKSIGRESKTDAVDAHSLALFALRNKVEPSPIPDEKTVELKALLNRRRQLVHLRTAEKNRLHGTRHQAMRQSIQNMLDALDEEIAAVDAMLDDAVEDDDDFRSKAKLLTSVPGVGEQTARTLLGEMPELGTLNRREAASLAGLAPYAHDSGKQRGKRSIRGGRLWVRNSLYMATLAAVRSNQPIRRIYLGLIERGKAKKVALTACMRKLLLLLNALLKKNEVFV